MLTRALKKQNEALILEAKVAKTFFERFCGLMGRKNLTREDIVVFPHCTSIHTFFMREKIDVIFVSAEGLVTKIFYSLKPWKMLMPQKKAAHCIEMASGEAEKLGIHEGDFLVCEGVF
jgi:uncharacterized membrane protein (UPF0127 family)